MLNNKIQPKMASDKEQVPIIKEELHDNQTTMCGGGNVLDSNVFTEFVSREEIPIIKEELHDSQTTMCGGGNVLDSNVFTEFVSIIKEELTDNNRTLPSPATVSSEELESGTTLPISAPSPATASPVKLEPGITLPPPAPSPGTVSPGKLEPATTLPSPVTVSPVKLEPGITLPSPVPSPGTVSPEELEPGITLPSPAPSPVTVYPIKLEPGITLPPPALSPGTVSPGKLEPATTLPPAPATISPGKLDPATTLPAPSPVTVSPVKLEPGITLPAPVSPEELESGTSLSPHAPSPFTVSPVKLEPGITLPFPAPSTATVSPEELESGTSLSPHAPSPYTVSPAELKSGTTVPSLLVSASSVKVKSVPLSADSPIFSSPAKECLLRVPILSISPCPPSLSFRTPATSPAVSGPSPFSDSALLSYDFDNPPAPSSSSDSSFLPSDPRPSVPSTSTVSDSKDMCPLAYCQERVHGHRAVHLKRKHDVDEKDLEKFQYNMSGAPINWQKYLRCPLCKRVRSREKYLRHLRTFHDLIDGSSQMADALKAKKETTIYDEILKAYQIALRQRGQTSTYASSDRKAQYKCNELKQFLHGQDPVSSTEIISAIELKTPPVAYNHYLTIKAFAKWAERSSIMTDTFGKQYWRNIALAMQNEMPNASRAKRQSLQIRKMKDITLYEAYFLKIVEFFEGNEMQACFAAIDEGKVNEGNYRNILATFVAHNIRLHGGRPGDYSNLTLDELNQPTYRSQTRTQIQCREQKITATVGFITLLNEDYTRLKKISGCFGNLDRHGKDYAIVGPQRQHLTIDKCAQRLLKAQVAPGVNLTFLRKLGTTLAKDEDASVIGLIATAMGHSEKIARLHYQVQDLPANAFKGSEAVARLYMTAAEKVKNGECLGLKENVIEGDISSFSNFERV